MQIESGQLIIPKEKIGIAFLLLREWERTKAGERITLIKPKSDPNKIIVERSQREVWSIANQIRDML